MQAFAHHLLGNIGIVVAALGALLLVAFPLPVRTYFPDGSRSSMGGAMSELPKPGGRFQYLWRRTVGQLAIGMIVVGTVYQLFESMRG